MIILKRVEILKCGCLVVVQRERKVQKDSVN